MAREDVRRRMRQDIARLKDLVLESRLHHPREPRLTLILAHLDPFLVEQLFRRYTSEKSFWLPAGMEPAPTPTTLNHLRLLKSSSEHLQRCATSCTVDRG